MTDSEVPIERFKPSVRVVEVAVPYPIWNSFSYLVPEHLKSSLGVGSRVSIPWGNRQIVGILIESRVVVRGQLSLKEISGVLDAQPVLSPALVRLAKWIAGHYLSPIGEAVRIMLPPGLFGSSDSADRVGSRRRVAITSINPDIKELSARQKEVLSELSGRQLPVLVQEFLAEARTSRGLIQTLKHKDAIRLGHLEVRPPAWDQWEAMGGRALDPHELTADQKEALEGIQQLLLNGETGSLLLHGVTGSGKTEIYLNALREVTKLDKTGILLVPEIALTPQMANSVRGWFGEGVAILHSRLSSGQRLAEWRRIRSGGVCVVLGTRSALFAPLDNLGLIIIDEEHDGSYRQQETPRYHARETALRRGKEEGAVVVLGSATPQIETYYLASEIGRHHYRGLFKRVLGRPLPSVELVDMRAEFAKHGPSIISERLDFRIAQSLEAGEQVLILINRRGFSPVLLCRSCGFVEKCPNCSVSLTYHRSRSALCCHYCQHVSPVPQHCPECGKKFLYFLGEGTEKIEEVLRTRYASARIDRLDRDRVQKRGSLRGVLKRFSRGEIDVLVGTQMIAKGHDFPGVTVVGVLAADQALRISDFRSAERTFQLLTQVAGRSGRGDSEGHVVIQTFFPNHYSIQSASTQDYLGFYRRELQFRKRFRYPPFTLLASLVIHDPDVGAAQEFAAQVAERLQVARDKLSDQRRMRILGPALAPLEKVRGNYRVQILVKATSRAELNKVVRSSFDEGESPPRKLSIEIEPSSLV